LSFFEDFITGFGPDEGFGVPGVIGDVEEPERTYITPFTTSRMTTVRLPPPRFAGGITGSMSAHSSSIRSLG
jgi:hypothetical protein